MSDSTIPADLRWNSALYTSGGQSASMTNTAFIIVTVEYDTNAGTTGLTPINVEITNSLHQPGAVIKDYLLNARYGCAIPLASIDTASLTALDSYSAEQINYLNNGSPATQDRYRINGPIQTGDNCLTNLQQLVDACDSWLQYSELVGKWKVVINKPFTGAVSSLYQVTDSNLMSGINVNPIDLNSAYNVLEVQFPNTALLDKTDYAPLNLVDYVPEVMSYNEPVNKLTVQFPQVNNYVQAVYLGERRLLQSREDLVIDFALDYSGIQIEAGDVIAVDFTPYGWEAFNSGYGKLFRVSQVQEAKIDDGSLGVKITAFEYNDTIYANNPFEDFVPESNTGLTDPNIFDRPTTPVVANGVVANGAINYYTVSSNVPAAGTTLYMDFNIGNSSNLQTHKSYSSVQVGDGTPYTANSTVTINVADSSTGTYYWSATARNDVAGRQSNSSTAFTWGGPSVSTYNGNTGVGGIGFNNLNGSLVKSQVLAQTSFSIPSVSTNTVLMPVDISTIFNVPVYLDGTTVGTSYVFPYYQGTSSTANGYLANSTSSFNPALASVLEISNGTDNWWILMYDTATISAGWTVANTLEMGLVADSNTTVQICPFYTLSTLPGIIIAYTYLMDTYQMTANLPQKIVTNTTFPGSASQTGFGYIIKNLVSGTRVITLSGGHTVLRTS
jgi:hypothetical protein